MSHVKCKYNRYFCEFGEDCYNCNFSTRQDSLDDVCQHLECTVGYYELDSRSIDFDGEVLIIGKKFAARDETCDYSQPTAGENIIDYLEIDGTEYINYEKQREEFKNARDELERKSQEEG